MTGRVSDVGTHMEVIRVRVGIITYMIVRQRDVSSYVNIPYTGVKMMDTVNPRATAGIY